MQTPIPQLSTQDRDRLMTEYLYIQLRQIPYDIEALEVAGAHLSNAKREAEQTLEDAELNALLTNQNDGKNEAARKLIDRAALQKDPACQKARKDMLEIESELEQNEVTAKAKRREFQAAIALAELHAARINGMYRINAQQHSKDAS